MTKNTKAKAGSPKQPKSRAKYPCPPEFEEMIRMVRLVPFGTDFLSFNAEAEAQERIFIKETGKTPEINIRAILKDLLSKLPEDAQKFIRNRLFFENSPAPVDLDNASRNELQDLVSCYKHFYYLWADMWIYITQRKEHRSGNVSGWGERLQPIHAFIIYDFDSTVNEKLFGFSGQIGKFDGDRLRICEICNRVFWAKKDVSTACPNTCANTLRVRLSRSLTDEQKAERKAKREANRELIKNGKAKSTKRNK